MEGIKNLLIFLKGRYLPIRVFYFIIFYFETLLPTIDYIYCKKYYFFKCNQFVSTLNIVNYKFFN